MGLLQNGVSEMPTNITLTTAMQHITKVLRDAAVNVENTTAAYRNHSACAVIFRDAVALLQTEIRNLRSLILAMFVQEPRGNRRVSWRSALPDCRRLNFQTLYS